MMTTPDRDGKIFFGKGTSEEALALALANRHSLVTGATGTGKTVSLQVLAEGFSRAGAPGQVTQAPPQPGLFHRMGDHMRNIFGIGRPHGTVLTTSQQVARNVARAVAVGVATQVAAELTKSTGSKTAGTLSKAVVRGALGGVMRR